MEEAQRAGEQTAARQPGPENRVKQTEPKGRQAPEGRICRGRGTGMAETGRVRPRPVNLQKLSFRVQSWVKASGSSPSPSSQARSSGESRRSRKAERRRVICWMSTPTSSQSRAHRARGPLWLRLKRSWGKSGKRGFPRFPRAMEGNCSRSQCSRSPTARSP